MKRVGLRVRKGRGRLCVTQEDKGAEGKLKNGEGKSEKERNLLPSRWRKNQNGCKKGAGVQLKNY